MSERAWSDEALETFRQAKIARVEGKKRRYLTSEGEDKTTKALAEAFKAIAEAIDLGKKDDIILKTP